MIGATTKNITRQQLIERAKELQQRFQAARASMELRKRQAPTSMPMPAPASPQAIVTPKPAATPKPAEAARAVLDQAAPLIRVIQSIPWPHEFFRAYVLTPGQYARKQLQPGRIWQTPFYRGIPITDLAALVQAGYMQRSEEAMRRDLARWLLQNEANLEEHFFAVVQAWIRARERRAKKKAGRLGALSPIVGGVLAITGIGIPIASIASAAVGVRSRQVLSESQKRDVKKLQQMLNISDEKLAAFRSWIAQYGLSAEGSQEAAQSMPGSIPGPVVPPTGSGYTVLIEGKAIATVDNPDQATGLALQNARRGDRVEIVDPAGQSAGLWVWTGETMERVPDEAMATIRQANHGEIVRILEMAEAKSGKARTRVPWEIIGVVAGGALLLLS